MNVHVNGKPRPVPDRCTVGDLISILGLRTRSVVVERNGEPLERSQFASVVLDEGDVLEVVRPVQGGAGP